MANDGCAVCGTEDAGRIDPDQSLDICIDCLHASAEGIRIESHEREGGLQSIQPGMPDVADRALEIVADFLGQLAAEPTEAETRE